MFIVFNHGGQIYWKNSAKKNLDSKNVRPKILQQIFTYRNNKNEINKKIPDDTVLNIFNKNEEVL
jgi:uncharacterized coiled-coil DUF342 family protein